MDVDCSIVAVIGNDLCATWSDVLLLANRDAKFFELFGIDDVRRCGHQIGGLLRFWEGDAIADVVQAAQQHNPTINSQSDAAVRGGAELERVE